MQTVNIDGITFGRRLNLVVTSEQVGRDIEPCSLEFKKGKTSYTIANIRTYLINLLCNY